RYDLRQEPADLDLLVPILVTLARRTPNGDPARSQFLTRFVTALAQRVAVAPPVVDLGPHLDPLAQAIEQPCREQAERATRLTQAIAVLEHVTKHIAADHPDRHRYLHWAGLAYGHKYLVQHDPIDLDRCIEVLADEARLRVSDPAAR